MDQENPSDLQVEVWLKTLGLDSLSQWDVLVFLFRHPTSLVSAEHIARLLGYVTAPVVDALDRLESLGFVERSRAHQAVRLYQFTAPPPSPPPRGDALRQLVTWADNRAVRLLLAKRLRQNGQPGPKVGQPRLPREERSASWLKVV